MAYSIKLEELIDSKTARWQNMGKKKMFGGVCYLIGKSVDSSSYHRAGKPATGIKGNMCFGIWKDFLIVRMDKDLAAQSLKDKNVKPFDITGKPMAGWVLVKEAGWKGSAELTKWLGIGKKFASSLPEKKAKVRKKKTLKEYKD